MTDDNGQPHTIDTLTKPLLEKLHNPIAVSDKSEVHKFVFDLAASELLEYAEALLECHGPIVPLRQPVKATLKKLLERYSVAELCTFIDEMMIAANNLGDHSAYPHVSDESLAAFLRPLYRNARSKKWNPEIHVRRFDRSRLSVDLYENIVSACDIGFEKNLNNVWKKHMLTRFQ